MECQKLILIRGYPGVGKTTFAMLLARNLKGAVVCKDDIRDEAAKLEKNSLWPSGLNTNAMCYDAMWRVVARQLEVGLSVVVESPLGRKDLYLKGLELASTYDALAVVVHCELSRQVWEQRLNRRKQQQTQNEEEDHKPTDAAEILAHYSKDAYDVDDSKLLSIDCEKQAGLYRMRWSFRMFKR